MRTYSLDPAGKPYLHIGEFRFVHFHIAGDANLIADPFSFDRAHLHADALHPLGSELDRRERGLSFRRRCRILRSAGGWRGRGRSQCGLSGRVFGKGSAGARPPPEISERRCQRKVHCQGCQKLAAIILHGCDSLLPSLASAQRHSRQLFEPSQRGLMIGQGVPVLFVELEHV